MAERKGIHWLVWVGGGCAVLGLLVMVGVVGMGVFAAKKVADVATEMTENPIATLAKAYALANPEVEFVEADEEGRTVTFRNVATGETATFDFTDLESGQIRFEGSDGTSIRVDGSDSGVVIDAGDDQVRFGASPDGDGVTVDTSQGSATFGTGSDVPSWVPLPEGLSPEVTFSASSGDSETGAFQVEGSSLDALAQQWKDLLVEAGYSIETEFSSGGARPTKMLVGKLESEGRQVSVTVTDTDGTVRGIVNYASGLR